MYLISDWVPVYPKSVILRNGRLTDKVTRKIYYIDDKEIFSTLKKVDGNRKLKRICKDSSFYQVFIEMNKKGLVNFKIPAKQQISIWLKYTVSFFGNQNHSLPCFGHFLGKVAKFYVPDSRLDVPDGPFYKIFISLFVIILKMVSPLLIIFLLPAVVFFTLLNFPLGIFILNLLALSVVFSFAVHEFAHIFILCKNKKTKNFFIKISSHFSVSIVKPSGCPREEFFTAIAGPLCTITISCLFFILSFYLENAYKLLAGLEGFIFASASISIIPIFDDGKIALAYITGRNYDKT